MGRAIHSALRRRCLQRLAREELQTRDALEQTETLEERTQTKTDCSKQSRKTQGKNTRKEQENPFPLLFFSKNKTGRKKATIIDTVQIRFLLLFFFSSVTFYKEFFILEVFCFYCKQGGGMMISSEGF